MHSDLHILQTLTLEQSPWCKYMTPKFLYIPLWSLFSANPAFLQPQATIGLLLIVTVIFHFLQIYVIGRQCPDFGWGKAFGNQA